MKILDNLKIKSKMIGIILFTTIITLCIAFIVILFLGKSTLQNSISDKINTIAKVIGNNLIPVFDFGTGQEAEERYLRKLAGVASIKNAFVFDSKDNLYAQYNQSETEKIIPPPVKQDSIELSGKYFHIYSTIKFENEKYGTIYLRATTEELNKKVNNFFIILLLVIVFLIFFSILLALKLQKIISQPILDIASISKKVSSDGNYSIRIRKNRNDEIGMLTESFNEMMEQINKRDLGRDKVEQELKRSQFFLRSVIESMPSILITIGENGEIKQWNNSAVSLFGIKVENALGKNLWSLLPWFEELDISLDEIINNRKPLQFYKKSIDIRKHKYYFNISIFQLMEQKLPEFVIMLDNITEIELKEHQLRQSQKMESIGTLAGGMAHDFNNVLGGIIGTISLAKYKIAKGVKISTEEIDQYFTTIEEASNKASDLVQHLLSLARRQELSLGPIDLNQIISNIVKICRNSFDKSIEIENQVMENRAMVLADETQMEQTLLNLCINASHAMTTMREQESTHGGFISITLEQITADKYFCAIHPDAEITKDYWILSVRDTGIGMDPEEMGKIFDPFYTTKTGGTGLGLTMVYNIIKQHQGFVDVYSQKEVGSTFNIYLPVLKTISQKKEKVIAQEIQKGEGCILIIDDEEIVRQTAKAILEECGYQVLVADNGVKGIAIYKKKKDIIKGILLDLVMPKLSGKQTYLKLKRIDQKVKVLLSSGFKKDSRIESILEAGVDGFINKPYSLTSLSKAIYEVIHS